MPAIRHQIKTDHTCTAICDIRWYDVWGNEEDGWQVNDIAYTDRNVELPARLFISNVPVYPGAKDEYRQFSDEHNFSAEILLDYIIDDEDIKNALGWTDDVNGEIEIDFNDGTYYINEVEGKPIAEVNVVGWKMEE